MKKNKHKNIIIGTGRLGRNEGLHIDTERLKAINFLLSNGCGIHISPTYGNSFQKLKKINFNHSPKVIAKIDFSRESKPEIQLILTRRLIRHNKIDVQISGDMRNILYGGYNLEQFETDLKKFKIKYGIDNFFLSPLYHDSDYLIDLSNKSSLNFNFALHYSLIESEFKSNFITKKNKLSRIFALRAFGESINNYGDWYQPLGMEIKPNKIKIEHKKSLEKILNQFEIKNSQARLIFALKNPFIDYSALSFSNINQAKEALKINEYTSDKVLIDSLIKNNIHFANKNRKGYGFRYPANTQYLKRQAPIEIIVACLKSNNFIYCIKNLFNIFCENCFKFLKLLYRKLKRL